MQGERLMQKVTCTFCSYPQSTQYTAHTRTHTQIECVLFTWSGQSPW